MKEADTVAESVDHAVEKSISMRNVRRRLRPAAFLIDDDSSFCASIPFPKSVNQLLRRAPPDPVLPFPFPPIRHLHSALGPSATNS